jgi:hypothetical protein
VDAKVQLADPRAHAPAKVDNHAVKGCGGDFALIARRGLKLEPPPEEVDARPKAALEPRHPGTHREQEGEDLSLL